MPRKASALLALLAASASAAAAVAQPKLPPTEAFRYNVTQGPVTITADRAEFDRSGTMLYRGRVRLVSGQIELSGDRLELQQPAAGQYQARVTGKPARLRHSGQGQAPPVAASAGVITYDSRTAIMELGDGVRLDRGTDVLSGDRMSYDVAARRISAAGAEGGQQVRIVIRPPEKTPPAGTTP